MNENVKLSMKEFGLNPLHYVSLPGYSFDCWLMSSGVTLDTLQDKQMLDDFVEAKRGGICGIMGIDILIMVMVMLMVTVIAMAMAMAMARTMAMTMLRLYGT